MENFYNTGQPQALLQMESSSATPSAGSTALSPFNFYQDFEEAGFLQTIIPNRDSVMEAIMKVFNHNDQSARSHPDNVDDEDELIPFDLEEQRLRTEKLTAIGSALDQLWWSDPDSMALAAEKLADGSRDPQWRIPIGNCGILDAFLIILALPDIRTALVIHSLRLIGNSCADTDENRARVVGRGSIPSIMALLKDESLLPFVVPVLFNICVDYEPAQKQASEAHLSKTLVKILSSSNFENNRAFLGYICKLLDMLSAQPTEADIAPDNTVDVLVSLAASREHPPDLEDFTNLMTTAINYLRHVRFQIMICQSLSLDNIMRLMLSSFTRLENSTNDPQSPPDPENVKQLSILRNAMNQMLSDVSALPEFAIRCPIISPMSSSLRRWLSSPQPQLQACACIMLGNLARSDAACEEFVRASQIHKPLISLITTATDSQILYTALGFLKNLALPPRNKSALGDASLIPVLPRLWAIDSLPQIQYSSISLTRQLVINNFSNAIRINAHLSPDPNSPASQKTYVSLLLALFERTDAEPVRMEIARLLGALCRVFSSANPEVPDAEARRDDFYSTHPQLGRVLALLVTQKKWPAIRSEGWFVLALMARSEEGAAAASDALHSMEAHGLLAELLTGKSFLDEEMTSSEAGAGLAQEAEDGMPDAGQAAKQKEMVRFDRENALVLVSELLKNHGDRMASLRRNMLEDLLKDGGALHVGDQEAGEKDFGVDVKREGSAMV